MSSKTPAKRELAVKPALRDPTAAESAAAVEAASRAHLRPARARVEISRGAGGALDMVIGPPHSDARGWTAHLKDTLGTSSNAYVAEALQRISRVLQERDELTSKQSLNAALALLGAIAPRDELEAAIGEQIASAHSLSMEMMHRAKVADTIPKMEAYANMATKVSRTMSTHIDTLAKLRSGGKQTHEVRYVYVNGPAVIGDHAQAVFDPSGVYTHGASVEKTPQPHESGLPALPSPEVRRQDAGGLGLPVAGAARKEAVPASRGTQHRRADRQRERKVPDRPPNPGTERGAGTGPARAGDSGKR